MFSLRACWRLWRALVHAYGDKIVSVLRQSGIGNPIVAENVILACWIGARSSLNRSAAVGKAKEKRVKARPVEMLDWLLIQAGAQTTARRLLAALYHQGWAVAPSSPSGPMIDASMAAEVPPGTPEREAHVIRLRAALRASGHGIWSEDIVKTRSKA